MEMDDTEKYRPEKIFCKRRKISGFIVDETQVEVGKKTISGFGLQLNLSTN